MPSPILPLLMVATAGLFPDAPLACHPRALAKEERVRQQELLKLVRSSAREVLELPDGYAIRLGADAGLFRQAAEWISLERRCCPFLAFSLEWSVDDSVLLRMTGASGVKEALRAEILGDPPR